jgi:hypothetical protein
VISWRSVDLRVGFMRDKLTILYPPKLHMIWVGWTAFCEAHRREFGFEGDGDLHLVNLACAPKEPRAIHRLPT